MYMAKEAGKGRYQVFEPAMHDTALRRLELKADLQRASRQQRVHPALPARHRAPDAARSKGSKRSCAGSIRSEVSRDRSTSCRSRRRPG